MPPALVVTELGMPVVAPCNTPPVTLVVPANALLFPAVINVPDWTTTLLAPMPAKLVASVQLLDPVLSIFVMPVTVLVSVWSVVPVR